MKKYFTKYFGFTKLKITEGGNARNSAIVDYSGQTNCEMFVFHPANLINRLALGLNFLSKLFFYKNEKVFIHYSILPYFFTEKLICNWLVLKLVFYFLEVLDKNNEITLEVNDLPYEQAIDLALQKNKLNKLDAKLFRLKNAKFVFASKSMRSYVIDKYAVAAERTSVLINGAPTLALNGTRPIRPGSEPLNLVYAGSLNRGRQLEVLINIFKKSRNNIYLLGDAGEWLTNSPYLDSNIKYLGSMDEKSAHTFVAKCDVGLLPYDSTRFYYNLCYPTKASFYITAGLPFISTHLKEMKLHFSDDVVIYESIDKWRDIIDSDLFRSRIFAMQCNVREIRQEFEWKYLIEKWLGG